MDLTYNVAITNNPLREFVSIFQNKNIFHFIFYSYISIYSPLQFERSSTYGYQEGVRHFWSGGVSVLPFVVFRICLRTKRYRSTKL